MPDNIQNIAIIGATSHIAKGLIINYLTKTDSNLFLLTRNNQKLLSFLNDNNMDMSRLVISDNLDLINNYNTIINCIGIRYNPKILNQEYEIFFLTEFYDNLILNYLKSNQQTIYINFSSGAIYRDFSKPAFFDSKSSITINHIDSKDFYSIAKINSEAKHRSNNSLTIFDIRVFSYFSKFIDLEGPSFITEIICCLKNNIPFITNSNDMLRDYSGSDDLFQLVKKCSEHSGVNSGFDLYTTNPVSKFEIIDFFSKNYSLKWEIEKSIIPATLTGYKNQYFSENRKAEELGFKPVCSSIEVIRNVSKQILGR